MVQEVQFWMMNLGSGCSKFGILTFVPVPNGKCTHFLIFYAVRTFGSVQGSVFSGMFEGSKFGFRGRTYAHRFGRFVVQFS